MDSLNLHSCRMCLVVPDDEALTFSVFDTFKGKNLDDLIQKLFGIKISREDHLLNICLECVNRINTVQKINHTFTENNEKLKILLDKIREDSQEIELLVIDENELLNEAEQQKKSDLEIEVLSVKTEAEVTSTEDVEDLNDVSEEHQQQVYLETFEDESLDETPELDSEEQPVMQNYLQTSVKDEKPIVPIPKHKCYFCQTVFDTEMAFTQHLHVHFGEVPLVCQKCDNLVIKTVRQASKHLALHDENERPHKCRICELRFFTRENSLTHERKIHRMKVKIQQNIDGYADRRKMKKFECKYCGQTAPTSQILRKHEMTHGPPQAVHSCEVCKKQFSVRKNLTRHMMIHTGELPYKCDICQRAFRQAGDLKDHIRGHTKEKPYVCNSCDTRFRNVSMLHAHKRKRHPPETIAARDAEAASVSND